MRSLQIGFLGAIVGVGLFAIISNHSDTIEGTNSSGPSSGNGTSKEIADLLDKERDLNDKCRDGRGDEQEVEKLCGERDNAVSELLSKGWCWGEEGQAEYQMTWHQCAGAPQSRQSRVTTPFAPGQGSSSVQGILPDDGAVHPSPYRFTVAASGGFTPAITGAATVPEGTRLLINIKKPWLPDAMGRLARGLAACGNNCLPATGPDHKFGIGAVVENGRFTAGPFSFDGEPFTAKTYPLEIFVLQDLNAPGPLTKEDMVAHLVYAAKIEVTEKGELLVIPYECVPDKGVTDGCPVPASAQTAPAVTRQDAGNQ